MDIADHQAEIERLRKAIQSRPTSASSNVEFLTLQRETDELKLYLAAIIRLLVAKNVATTDEIRALVAAVDLEDGVEEGNSKVRSCPKPNAGVLSVLLASTAMVRHHHLDGRTAILGIDVCLSLFGLVRNESGQREDASRGTDVAPSAATSDVYRSAAKRLLKVI